MRFIKILLWLFVSVLPLAAVNARMGKAFFDDGHWIKGDIQVQQNASGKEEVVIAVKSGSLIFKKSDIKNIIYTAPGAEPSKRFIAALKNTRQKPVEAKSNSVYDSYIRIASAKHQMDPELVRAVIRQESNFNYRDISHKGAQGLMQLMPDTAKKLGVQDAFDPWENIHGGTRYLRMMIENFNGDLPKALAAYNAGPSVVKKYGTIPPYQETQGYVKNVLRYYQMYRGGQLYAFEDKKGQLVITDQPFLP